MENTHQPRSSDKTNKGQDRGKFPEGIDEGSKYGFVEIRTGRIRLGHGEIIEQNAESG